MRRALLGLVVVVAIAACGSDAWPKAAGETTCAEWLDEMTTDQREGLAGAILTILWEKDGAAEEPPDAVVLRFANAIGGTCTAWRQEKVSAVGSTLYELSNDVKPGSS
jgi:hypothetical protein